MRKIIKLIKITCLSLIALFAVFLAPHAYGAEYDVYMYDYGFDPDYLEIQEGDIVWWTNDDDWGDTHSTTSTDGYWDLTVQWGYTRGIIFPYAGTYPYYCKYTYITGTIVVNSTTPQPPPPPVLTDPARLPDSRFQFTVTNLVIDRIYVVEMSTNLANGTWTAILTNTASDYSFVFVDDISAISPQRYYRVGALP